VTVMLEPGEIERQQKRSEEVFSIVLQEGTAREKCHDRQGWGSHSVSMFSDRT
jgi:hypothetical protein